MYDTKMHSAYHADW